jgi:hypothetical protein
MKAAQGHDCPDFNMPTDLPALSALHSTRTGAGPTPTPSPTAGASPTATPKRRK